MRYSILGFNQQRVLSLSAIVKDNKGEDCVLTLDTNDLLILNLIADFPNRVDVKKIMKYNKVFFWASYKEIIDELPILNIKKQALANRFDKLEKMHLVEREYIAVDAKHQNATFFCLTKTYESLLYERGGYRSEIRDGIVVEYDTHNNNITNDNNNKEKEILKEKKSNDDEFVDRIYAMYPSKCPVRNTHLGKCSKDKDRIRKLLKMYSKEDIENVVVHEVEGKFGKSMMQNFSTFLNNFPDPSSLFADNVGGSLAYPLSDDDVNEDDIMPTYDFFERWLDEKCRNLLDNIRGGFPSNNEQFKRLAEFTKEGTKGVAYVCLVLNRDGWEKYNDERGFMWIYSNYIKDNGLYNG